MSICIFLSLSSFSFHFSISPLGYFLSSHLSYFLNYIISSSFVSYCICLNNVAISASLFFIFVLSTHLTINKCSIKVCWWLDSNADLRCRRRPLYQLSHKHCSFFCLVFLVPYSLPPSLSLCNWMGHPNINFFLNFVCLNSFHFLLILHIGLLSLNSLSLVNFLDLVSMHFLLCLERGLSEKVNK